MQRRIGPSGHYIERDELTPEEIATFEEYPDVDRPKVRGDCWDFKEHKPIGTRPCPFVTCRYNNFLEVTPSGTILAMHPGVNPEDIPPNDSCALDVAERDVPFLEPGDPAIDLDELGKIVGLTGNGVNARISAAQKNANKARRKLKAIK